MAQAQERSRDDIMAFLEADQLVADTARPVTRASLGRRTRTALWALRVFVILVTLMVVYAFVTQLH